MSLEARVNLLEKQQQALDDAFRENNRVIEATHGVVSMILSDQQGMKQELFEFKLETRERFDQIDKQFNQIDKRLDQLDKRFNQLELLIRQNITHN